MLRTGDRRAEEQVSNLREELRVVFSKIKEEFEDHLESINQNTIEIQSSFEYLSRLSNRVDKLEQRMSRFEMDRPEEHRIETVLLTRDEEEVFAILVENTRRRQLLTYEDLAYKARVSKTFSAHLVASLVDKGIPVGKRFSNGSVLLEIDPGFAQRPAFDIATID